MNTSELFEIIGGKKKKGNNTMIIIVIIILCCCCYCCVISSSIGGYFYMENKETPAPEEGTDTSGTGTDTSGAGTDTSGTGTDTSGAGTDTSGTGTDTSGSGTSASGSGTSASGTGTDASGTGTDASGDCSSSDRGVCTSAGSTCRVLENKVPICEWKNATTKALCNNSSGIWTKSTDTWASDHPGGVPYGKEDACITQVSNLKCSTSDEDKCAKVYGNCRKMPSGIALCNWSNNTTKALCDSSSGIWTKSTDGWASNHPGGVPYGKTAACISQASNF